MDILNGLQTHDKLKQAFRLEAGTVQRYLYFARIADIEGFPDVAQTFRDLAESGICNAHGNLDFLKRVGDPDTDLPIGETDQNLTAAISSTSREQTESYPIMAKTAHEEGLLDIANWFETMAKTKKAHERKLRKALAQLPLVIPEEQE
jgi:rubrerythrin